MASPIVKWAFFSIESVPQDEEVAVSGGRVMDGEWVELEGGVLRTEFEGACGEAFVGAQRLIPARSPNLEGVVPNQNTALPPYNIVKGLLLETETCTRGDIQCCCET